MGDDPAWMAGAGVIANEQRDVEPGAAGLAAAAVLLVAAPAVVYQRGVATRAAAATMVSEAIGDHLRIVQAQRPLEIESGDGHRVRPWFEGRLEFSPVLPFGGDGEVPLVETGDGHAVRCLFPEE